MFKRFLAFMCQICPFCIAARRHPDSKYAAKLRAMEKNCPACRAYAEIHRQPAQGKASPSDD